MAQWLAQLTHNQLVVGSNPTRPTIFYTMKKVLILLLLLISNLSFSQTLVHETIKTNYYSSSYRNWDSKTNSWVYTDKDPTTIRFSYWEIIINENRGGEIISGDIRYTIKQCELNKELMLVKILAYSHKLNRDVYFVIDRGNGYRDYMISFFDTIDGISYVFWE